MAPVSLADSAPGSLNQVGARCRLGAPAPAQQIQFRPAIRRSTSAAAAQLPLHDSAEITATRPPEHGYYVGTATLCRTAILPTPPDQTQDGHEPCTPSASLGTALAKEDQAGGTAEAPAANTRTGVKVGASPSGNPGGRRKAQHTPAGTQAPAGPPRCPARPQRLQPAT